MDSIVAAMVGAFAAYLFNLFHWKYAKKFEMKEKLANLVRQKLEIYGDICGQYWLCGNENSFGNVVYSKDEREKIEADIKNKYRVLVKFACEYFGVNYSGYRREKKEKYAYRILGDLFDISTGGEFEQNDRKANKRKASQISELCTEISIFLYKSSNFK